MKKVIEGLLSRRNLEQLVNRSTSVHLRNSFSFMRVSKSGSFYRVKVVYSGNHMPPTHLLDTTRLRGYFLNTPLTQVVESPR